MIYGMSLKLLSPKFLEIIFYVDADARHACECASATFENILVRTTCVMGMLSIRNKRVCVRV